MKYKTALFIIGLLLLSSCTTKESSDFIQCGIFNQVCPNGYETQFIGGQCLRCFIRDNNTIEYINMTKICEKFQIPTQDKSDLMEGKK